MSDTQVHVLVGPPCAGKTTLGTTLSKELKLPLIRASKLFKDLEKPKEALTQQEAKKLQQLQLRAVIKRLQEEDCKGGFILDNFPRTLDQAKALDVECLRKFGAGVNCMLDLALSTKVFALRAQKRLVKIKDDMPVKQGEEGKDAVTKRADDKPTRLRRRLQRYAKNIGDLRGYYGNDRCIPVDASQGESDIFTQASRQINEHRSTCTRAKIDLVKATANLTLVDQQIRNCDMRLDKAKILVDGFAASVESAGNWEWETTEVLTCGCTLKKNVYKGPEHPDLGSCEASRIQLKQLLQDINNGIAVAQACSDDLTKVRQGRYGVLTPFIECCVAREPDDGSDALNSSLAIFKTNNRALISKAAAVQDSLTRADARTVAVPKKFLCEEHEREAEAARELERQRLRALAAAEREREEERQRRRDEWLAECS